MQWFGEKPFARICLPSNHASAPVGRECAWCNEPIAEHEIGFISVHLDEHRASRRQPWHYECFARTLAGSVRHQLRKCSCFGNEGECDQLDGRTKREEAKLAAEIWAEANRHD